ncbi:hypothetical protein Bbelb_155280 [Branchiostoma belcheri]|nr:hypothetical protein Bbelb_155280 [Branchiostoma belcheri]
MLHAEDAEDVTDESRFSTITSAYNIRIMSLTIPEGDFYIVNSSTGHVLSIKDQSESDKAELVILPKNDNDTKHQVWNYNAQQKTLQTKLTPYKVISIQGSSFYENATIINETYTAGQPHQQWKTPGDGTIQTSTRRDYVIGLRGGSGSSGTNAVLTTRTTQLEGHVMWRFESA